MQRNDNILLVHAKTDWYDTTRPETRFVNLNLGLLRMGAVLKKAGYSCAVLDLNNGDEDSAQVRRAVERDNISVVVISLDYKGIRNALDIFRELDKVAPRPTVVLTSSGIGFLGPATILARDACLAHSGVDFVFNGDENHFPLFLEALVKARGFDAVPGLGWEENGERRYNPIERASDFVEEDYSLVNMEEYIHRFGREIISPPHCNRLQRILPVSTGVGCAYKCSYCINANPQWKKRFKAKPAETFIPQLEKLIVTYRPDAVWFQDDNFFLDKERAEQALELVNRHNVKWCGQGRADHFRNDYINEDFFRDLLAPNCVWFSVGFETFSDELRADLNKKAGGDQLRQAAELCGKYGVPFNPAFIFGTIRQTKEQFKNDVLGLVEMHMEFTNCTFSHQLWRPYPDTPEYEKLVAAGFSISFPHTLEGWTNFHYYDTPDLKNGYQWISADVRRIIPMGIHLVGRYTRAGKTWKNFADHLLYLFHRTAFKAEAVGVYPIIKRLGEIIGR